MFLVCFFSFIFVFIFLLFLNLANAMEGERPYRFDHYVKERFQSTQNLIEDEKTQEVMKILGRDLSRLNQTKAQIEKEELSCTYLRIRNNYENINQSIIDNGFVKHYILEEFDLLHAKLLELYPFQNKNEEYQGNLEYTKNTLQYIASCKEKLEEKESEIKSILSLVCNVETWVLSEIYEKIESSTIDNKVKEHLVNGVNLLYYSLNKNIIKKFLKSSQQKILHHNPYEELNAEYNEGMEKIKNYLLFLEKFHKKEETVTRNEDNRQEQGEEIEINNGDEELIDREIVKLSNQYYKIKSKEEKDNIFKNLFGLYDKTSNPYTAALILEVQQAQEFDVIEKVLDEVKDSEFLEKLKLLKPIQKQVLEKLRDLYKDVYLFKKEEDLIKFLELFSHIFNFGLKKGNNKIIFNKDVGFHVDHKLNGDLDRNKAKSIINALQKIIPPENLEKILLKIK